MKVTLSRRYRFSASHRLYAPELSEEQNRALYGKCANPFGHGHNYTAQVTYAGTVSEVTGFLLDLPALDDFAHEHVLSQLDQANLNATAMLAGRVPSTENLTTALYAIFARFPQADLTAVHVEETGNNSFTLAGTPLPQPGKY